MSYPTSGLWMCGDRRIQLSSGDPAVHDVSWVWDASIANDIPPDRRDWLYSIDEVKPVTHDGEACLLLTASWRGAVALLRRRDRTLLFLAPLPNAHSADLLPGGWVAAAGSVGSDCLNIYHLSSGLLTTGPRLSLSLPHGHGVVYEPAHSRFWVCGDQLLRAYHWRAHGDTFACTLEREIILPDHDAHDLMVDAAGTGLIITTKRHVWRFDPVTAVVSPFALLADANDVKSVTYAADGTLAYTKAVGGTIYKTNEIVFVRPDGQLHRRHVPGGFLYKVRWDRTCQLSGAGRGHGGMAQG